MSFFSAAARNLRAAYSRTTIKPREMVASRLRRDRTVEATDADPTVLRCAGGPFLHWVPDRPDGARLAGDYLPVQLQPERQPVDSRRARRRR